MHSYHPLLNEVCAAVKPGGTGSVGCFLVLQEDSRALLVAPSSERGALPPMLAASFLFPTFRAIALEWRKGDRKCVWVWVWVCMHTHMHMHACLPVLPC